MAAKGIADVKLFAGNGYLHRLLTRAIDVASVDNSESDNMFVPPQGKNRPGSEGGEK